MFSGLVEETGVVVDFVRTDQKRVLRLRAPAISADLQIGDSVAVNGCCLTVTDLEGDILSFDLLEETIKRTSFSILETGLKVNLERALPADGRFGGHLVSGHIDTSGEIAIIQNEGEDIYLEVAHPEKQDIYVVEKGSISIDGVSLTVATNGRGRLGVWLIPHTLAMTQLSERQVGDPVNLEYDLIAKYIENMLKVSERI